MSVNKKNIYSRADILGVLTTLLLIIVITIHNFKISERNARDFQRNQNIGSIAMVLAKYYSDYGYYPISSPDYKIVACKGPQTNILKDISGKPVFVGNAPKAKVENMISCQWGKDALMDTQNGSFPKYLDPIPTDPLSAVGYSFRYESDGERYWLYTAYEGKTTIDYRKSINDKKLNCGTFFCSGGRTVGAAILD